MIRAISLTDPSRISGFDSHADALAFARGQGWVVSLTDREIVYSDFPRRNNLTHAIEIPPLPLTFLLDRKG